MLAKLVNIVRYLLGGGGLYFALTQVHSDLTGAVALASLTAVGFVGVLSFVSHVLLHEQDAQQIGFDAHTVSFQYEVGFANLGFGVTALISYVSHWGLGANVVLILAYAIYLAQAAVLHVLTARSHPKTRRANLIRAGLTAIFSGLMLNIAIQAINSPLF